jgi:hypothetical protein
MIAFKGVFYRLSFSRAKDRRNSAHLATRLDFDQCQAHCVERSPGKIVDKASKAGLGKRRKFSVYAKVLEYAC